MRTIIIAEAGVNHNGDIEIAKKLIKEAAAAGADYIKFQSFITANGICKDAPKADYQKLSTNEVENQYEMVQKLELSRSDHKELIAECQAADIKFLSTAFDIESLEMLVDLGINLIKVPSGEITNLPLLRSMAEKGERFIISTGMADLEEVREVINVFTSAGIPIEKITILHCTTEYPAPMPEVNLKAMVSLRKSFGTAVGYSDHTQGIEVPIAAVALGATIIEKHFTLSKDMKGPDHSASLEPKELKQMVESIRNIETALGDGIKKPSLSEVKNKVIARKSLVAITEIKKGETFTQKNIGAKRPGTGLSPMLWDEVIGMKATKYYKIDELIEL